MTIQEKVRAFQPGDEAAILQLFADTFGHARKPDRWRWQYAEHPHGLSWIRIAECGGDIVAHYAVMRAHLNCMGREIPAGQPCDTMVRSDQRGRGWYKELAAAVYSDAQTAGAKAILGFPNRSSFPGFLRSLQGHKIAALKCYSYRTGLRKIWGAVPDVVWKPLQALPNRLGLWHFRARLGSRVKIESSPRLPPGIEPLLQEFLGHEVLSLWKDRAYLQWRYERHPDNQYAFHVLSIDGQPDCLIVSRLDRETLSICEAISGSKNAGHMSTLLRYVTNLGFRKFDTQAVRFFGFDSGFFDTAFALAGFRVLASSDFIFAGRVLNDRDLETKFLLPHNWCISYGDTDVI